MESYAQEVEITYTRVFPNVAFDMPMGLTFAPEDPHLLYVPELRGTVRAFENDNDTARSWVFLDAREDVSPGSGTGEFYDIAFHPDYQSNGYCYVYYFAASPRTINLVRYTRDPTERHVVDPNSKLVILSVPHPGPQNHSGGSISFGPDGYLYLPIGDGGSWGDELGYGQDRTNLFGAVIRIDVDNPSGGLNYGIPPDNPYVGNSDGWREEIWAYGFRNPFRSSFDRQSGALWVGDVGEEAWEEINIVERGGNYGWSALEGPECFNLPDCDPSQFSAPVYAYPHQKGVPNSVTGGTVYWGNGIPELRGRYVFGDFTGRLWAMDFSDIDNPIVTTLDDTTPVVTIGVGPLGELYVPKLFNGQIVRIDRLPDTAEEEISAPIEFDLSIDALPNPSSSRTTIRLQVGQATFVRTSLFDMLGREIKLVFEGELAAGATRQVAIDTSDLAAGVYVVRGVSDGRTQSSILTIVK